jgi:hypothetical protein
VLKSYDSNEYIFDMDWSSIEDKAM